MGKNTYSLLTMLIHARMLLPRHHLTHPTLPFLQSNRTLSTNPVTILST